MKTTNHWSHLNMSNHRFTSQYHALRPGDTETHQYFSNDHMLLAVKGKNPYGVVDASGPQIRPELLEVVETAADYTVFEVPEEVIGLKALTLGTGYKRLDLLHATYNRVGKVVADALAHGVDVPGMAIDDIAISRRSGEVYLVPPLNFVTSEHNQHRLAETGLANSLEGLHSVFDQDAIDSLRSDLREGFAAS